MRDCSWSDPDSRGVEKMTIEVLRTRWRKVVVTREAFEAWLGTSEQANSKGMS
jgi:hypothetical protein